MLSGFKKPRRVAVFISGGGSTLQALLEMHHQIDIALVVANKRNSFGILKARRFGKKVIHLDKHMSYPALNEILKEYRIETLVLAGFMKLLPPDFVEMWKNNIINIHPSLLPLYPGLNSAEKSYNDNVEMGATLHQVVAEMDAGPILLQQKALQQPQQFDLSEAQLFLRRTEQHLLRELAVRGNL